MSEVAVTEITELNAEKVAGVATPANGSSFLFVKAAADTETCGTCDGTGKIRAGKVECPDCKGTGTVAKSDSKEADQEEEEVTGSKAAKAAEQAEWWLLDKALSADDRKAMPASSFAFVDKNGNKHLPIHDEGHVKAALGRFGQQDFSEAKGDAAAAKKTAAGKIKAAAKEHGIEVSDDSEVAQAVKKGAVQDSLSGTEEPKDAGKIPSGQSGLAGSVATGPKTPPPDASLTLGGETTAEIPAETQVNDHPGNAATTDAAGILDPAIAKATAVSSLIEAIDLIAAGRDAIKADLDDNQAIKDEATDSPGSMPWESYDAATLQQVAQCLAGCCAALDSIRQRETVEAMAGDESDMDDAWDLQEAGQALEYALGVAARLSYHEAAESNAAKNTDVVKVGRTLSGKNMTALEAAHKHLGTVIDGAKNSKAGDGSTSEEDEIVTTVTKGDLAEAIVAGVQTALKDQRDAEQAEKNANNGGDISEADIKPTASADADDVDAIAGGGDVKPEYVNKSEGESGSEDGSLSKMVADQLEELTKGLRSVEETVAKIAKRPRAGGPSLDGQARGISPAAEGRMSDEAAKSTEDTEIETLEKQLGEATDPLVKSELGQKLTYARLYKGLQGRQL